MRLAILITFSFFVFSEDEGYATNGDVQIYYKDFGPENNTPVLLVMGLGGQLTYWPQFFIEFLQENGYRPIVYDNRDVGLSTSFKEYGRPNFIWNYVKFYTGLPIRSTYSLGDMANDGLAVLDHLSIDKSHLVGMSMGGMISQHLASNNEERFYSLTLIASMAKTPDASTAPRGRLAKLLNDRSRREKTIEKRIERAVEIYSILDAGNTDFDTPEFKQGVIDNINRSKEDSGFSRQLLAILADKSREESVRNITLPTLIIHGELDPLIPFKEGLNTHKLINSSTFVPVKDMGHLLTQKSLDNFNSEIIVHLDSNS
jgi:pimeloyl-ACP methyl ester carboxylesterase